MAEEEGDVKKLEDPNGFNAANATDRRWHEKGSFSPLLLNVSAWLA